MANSDNPSNGAEFEKLCLHFFQQTGIFLERPFTISTGIEDYKRDHKFDLGSEKEKILVECKRHTWTKGNNAPSAKMSMWNEAMLYFLAVPKKYRKIFFVLKDCRNGESLAQYYIKRHNELIPSDVEIWEYDLITKQAEKIHHQKNPIKSKMPKEKSRSAKTTFPGFINGNGQKNLGKRIPQLDGTDHCQYVYVINCTECGFIYGANGSDIHLRKCPECQHGSKGLQLSLNTCEITNGDQ